LTRPEPWPDASSGGPLGDGRFALAAFRPRDVEALCQTVREQVALGHGIYPQGGKTSLDYGRVPGRPGVAIDTTPISRVIDYPFADMTITVEAGMTLSALRGILADQHQRLLVDAPFPDRATLGGIFATGTTGPRRYGAGRPRDQIIGVSFVTSQGIVVKGGGRVVKNVAGYDFPKLLCGSLGTLGIITQMTLKVRPIPEASAIAWIPLPDLNSSSGVLEQLNCSGTRPVALDLLNCAGARIIGEGLGLPSAQAVLVISYEDSAGSVRWQLDRLAGELRSRDFTIVQDAQVEALWAALAGFQAEKSGPVSLVANLRPSSAVSFIERLEEERWSVQAHAGNGLVRAHSLVEQSLEAAGQRIDQLRDLATRDGGNLIITHCPTDWKDRLRVWGEPRGDWALGERVRAALDPHAAMNPGRFVGC
jgi:glycolate oxidase FAD binding subunit